MDFETFDPNIQRTMAIAPENLEAILAAADSAGAMYSVRGPYKNWEDHRYYLVSFHGDSLRKAASLLDARRRREDGPVSGH